MHQIQELLNNEEKMIELLPNEPILLLEIHEKENEKNEIIINEKAIDIIEKINSQLAVVSIAGLYRTGKSSLLNWLLDQQSGFKVGPTVERCTRGIWLWGRPRKHFFKNPKDENQEKSSGYILLLDSEGIGGLEASRNYDIRIFSLLLLLSSKIIYNSIGTIDEKAITNLSFLANLSKNIQFDNNDENNLEFVNSKQNNNSSFPSFLWVVRDFSLDLVDEDGDPITSDEYLNKALSLQNENSSSYNASNISEKNQIRRNLLFYFKNRRCCTLIRPVENEEELQKVDALPIVELRPDFQKQLTKLKNDVYGDLQPKKIIDSNNVSIQGINGRMFTNLLRNYVKIMNNDGIPTVRTVWENIVMNESKKAIVKSLDFFKENTKIFTKSTDGNKSLIPCDERILLNTMEELKKRTLEYYSSITQFESNNNDNNDEYKKELLMNVDEIINELILRNNKSANDFCSNLIHRIYHEVISKNMDDNGNIQCNSLHDLTKDWIKLKEDYMKEAIGNEKISILYEFTQIKLLYLADLLLKKETKINNDNINKYEKKIVENNEKYHELIGKEEIYKKELENLLNTNNSILMEKNNLIINNTNNEKLLNEKDIIIDQEKKRNDELQNIINENKLLISKNQNTIKDLQDKINNYNHGNEDIIKENKKLVAEIATLKDEIYFLKKGNSCGCIIT